MDEKTLLRIFVKKLLDAEKFDRLGSFLASNV
jgi:hypothetical protein